MKQKGTWKFLLIPVIFTLTIALGACSGDKTGDDSSQITIGIPQDIEDSLDPHRAVAAGTREVLFNVFEGLVKPNSDGDLIPAVASEYRISEDGTTYTFTLRDAVTFHNGNPVTVEDIKASIDKCADTQDGDPLVAAYSNIKEVKIVDEKTVEIILKEADTDFLANMTTAIIPKDSLNQDVDPIGTGPYKFVSRSPQENIILEKYDGYWGTPANIEKVVFKVCSNPDSIVMNLEGGSIDMLARVSTAQASQLSDNFNILEGSMNLVQALYLNNDKKPFDDLRVRQALCYAINRQEIMDFVSDGKGTAIGSSMFPAFSKYFVKELNDTYSQNIEKAKELLSEAGYPDGFTMDITVPSNYTQHVDTAQVLKEELKQIGVTANINLVEWDTWLSETYTKREYQATVIGVDASALTARALLERFTSDSASNFVNYNNSEYDETFHKALLSIDDEEKTDYYKQCETILATDAANVYIQDLPELVAINKKYAGYEFYPLYAQDISKLYLVDSKE